MRQLQLWSLSLTLFSSLLSVISIVGLPILYIENMLTICYFSIKFNWLFPTQFPVLFRFFSSIFFRLSGKIVNFVVNVGRACRTLRRSSTDSCTYRRAGGGEATRDGKTTRELEIRRGKGGKRGEEVAAKPKPAPLPTE